MAPECKNQRLHVRLQSSCTIAALLAGLVIVAPASHATDAMPHAIARVMIYPGERIVTEMLAEKEMNAHPPGQAFASREQAIGKMTRRTLMPGQGIPLNVLRELDVVQSGKSVVLIFSSGGLTITGRGTALQSGANGDMIAVQNAEGNVVVRGRVQSDGTVRFND